MVEFTGQKLKVWNELRKRFKGVSTNIFEWNSLKSLKFLNSVLDFYKINVSDFLLGVEKENPSNYIIWSSRILSLSNSNPVMLESGKIALKKFSFEESKFFILHELRHILQYRKGYMTDNNIESYWNVQGEQHMITHETRKFLMETSIISYNELPWELDANMFALMSSFVNKQIIRNSRGLGGIYDICHNKYPTQV